MVPLLALLAPPALVAPARVAALRFERSLGAGIDFIQEITPEGLPGGPLVVNVVRLAPEVVSSRLSAALGQDRIWGTDPTFGRETVSGLASRRGTLVAINAGFFPYMGNPIGLHVEGGELVTEPSRERSSLIVTEDGKATVRAFRWSGSVAIDGETKPLSGLNRKPGKGSELLAFTPKFFPKTLATPDRFEIVLEGAPSPLRPGSKFTATVKSAGIGGETALEPGAFVLSAGGERADWLREKARVGSSITVDLGVEAVRGEALAPSTIRHSVTGAARILSGGSVDVVLKPESVAESFATTRHPRTAAGVCADGSVLLVTVDGRQAGLSQGVSLTELARILLRFGAKDALNLDGGGSTAMAINGGIVNAPSDASERPVADMLVVTQVGEAPDSSRLTLDWPAAALRVGDSLRYLGPVGVAESTLLWSQLGNVGFVDQSGVFRALRPGVGTVRVRVGDRLAEVVVRVETKSPPPRP